MADLPVRLVGPAALATSAATVYTAPATAGTYVAIRHIHICNETATAAWVTLSLGVDAAGKRLWYQQSIGAYDNYDWTGNIVMNASEVIQAYAQTAATLTATISGIVGP